MIGADLRQLTELDQKIDTVHLDLTLPTLVMAECVFVYMNPEKSSEIIKYFSDKFSILGFLNYEQINIDDNFGRIMIQNLKERGILMPGLPVCHDLESQKRRFYDCNFKVANAWTVHQIYKNHLDKAEVQRIESIERLDEKELLTQLLEHYCFVYAFKDATEQHQKLANILPK